MRPDSKSDNLGIIKAQIDFDQLRAGNHVKKKDLTCFELWLICRVEFV